MRVHGWTRTRVDVFSSSSVRAVSTCPIAGFLWLFFSLYSYILLYKLNRVAPANFKFT